MLHAKRFNMLGLLLILVVIAQRVSADPAGRT